MTSPPHDAPSSPRIDDLAETAALYAVMEGRYEQAQSSLTGWSRSELAGFGHQLEELLNMVNTVLEA